MRTVQMTLDDELVDSVERIFQKLKRPRSVFTRQALRESIHRFNATRLEAQHGKGYELDPVDEEAFSGQPYIDGSKRNDQSVVIIAQLFKKKHQHLAIQPHPYLTISD